ncbi:heterokaryon incompatibility protein-domain-containing protein [Nemania sp. FL0031]|nr:heterokaryon incompatibility protein-domain-containing protein [Nemania sp. FL0031]
MNESKYEYSLIINDDGIRILILEPAKCRDDDLKGSLQEVSLAQQRDDLIDPYTALSYVWGDLTLCDNILIDNCELGITKNLSAALRDLRDTSRAHRVWADAICIDQKNDAEKSNQVALMGEIYSGATHTVIYLGPHNLYVDAIIEWVKQHVDSDNPQVISQNSLVLFKDESTGGDVSLIDMALDSLLVNPWFRRIWVLQELVLSKEPWVQCGRKRVRWINLCRLLFPQLKWHRESTRTYRETDLETMDNLRIRYQRVRSNYGSDLVPTQLEEEEDELSLQRILECRKGCQVSDPRDVVFAHMGIISDRQHVEKFTKIDYRKTVSEVFAAVGRYTWSLRSPNEIVPEITPSPLRAIIPSWAPDWGIQIDQDRLRGKPSFPHALAVIVGRAAKILQLSDILPTASSFETEFKDMFHYGTFYRSREGPSWGRIVRFLRSTNESATRNVADLDSWPREIYALVRERKQYTTVKPELISSLLAQYLCWSYSKPDSGIDPSHSRLALLSDGNVIIATPEVSVGNIVAHLRQQWPKFIVRPCEPQATADSNRLDLKDSIYGHGSLVSVCESELRTHLNENFFYLKNFAPKTTRDPIFSRYPHPYIGAWKEPFIDGWRGGLEEYKNEDGVLAPRKLSLPRLVLY